jgi:hypothetical protein
MARKISVAALRQTLEDAKTQLDVNFGGNVDRKDQEIEKSLCRLEDATRTIRDIDHALAALEGVEDE